MQDRDDKEWDDLVADLYLSATDPAAAARLPVALARLAGAGSASLWSVDPRTGGVADRMLTDAPAEMASLYAGHYHKLDPWLARSHLMEWNTVVHGAGLIGDADLARGAFYNEFGARFGLFHVMGALLPLGPDPARPFGAVVVQRPRKPGAFGGEEAGRFARLLPHVRRALQLRAQVAGSAAAAQASALDGVLQALGVAAVVLDGHGRVLCSNAAAERLDAAGTGLALRGGGADRAMEAPAPGQTRRLHAAIADAARGGPGEALRLHSPSGDALLAVVSPLPRGSADPAGPPWGRVLLVLRPLGRAGGEALERLGIRLFGLTPAEAGAAAALCAGMSPKEIAEARGVRVSTVRTLLQRAQDKVGVCNLRDLVATFAALRA